MSKSSLLNDEVKRHYSVPGLGAAILDALAKAGKDIEHLTPEDLAPVDEFHVRGRDATLELARAAGLDASQRVLDVGSGLGGAARRLAHEFGCRVTGVDLTDEYSRVAAMLAERTGLSRLINFRQGNACSLPFPDAAFDVVWTQHAAMNIPDKLALYRELHRVLRPGGTLAIYDVLAGSVSPVIFPVPWARTSETSFLASPEELRSVLEESGFTISGWEDSSAKGREWFKAVSEKLKQGALPPVGFHLLLGADFSAMIRNLARNLVEGRIALLQVVARRQPQ